ncbi:hypothetical protein E4T56_gene163 [Termitomyces sp. T112]|nr:hypothetical protein E4T56_gene163 [Termitomyces sp. T112]
MLSRLVNMSGIALPPLRDWEVHFDTQGEQRSSSTAGTVLVIDLKALRSLMPSLPEHALQDFATECVAPACHSLRSIVKSDFDRVVEVLSGLELKRERNSEDDAPNSISEVIDISTACPLNLVSLTSQNVVPSSSHHGDISGQHSNVTLDSTQELDPCRPNFTIPTILVSPCAPSEHHMASRVPIQNSAFGDQLTVPSYPAFNQIFPPMGRSPYPAFMTFKALLYAYVLGGITFIPLVLAGIIFFTVYTSVPVEDANVTKKRNANLEPQSGEAGGTTSDNEDALIPMVETDDTPRTRKGWLTMRRTFEEINSDGGYVTIMRSFLDGRSKDPKRSRPKDMWYVVLKGKVLYLYEDEEMTECEAAIELGGHQVVIHPEGLLDGELFAKRNAICLKPKKEKEDHMPSVTKEMMLGEDDVEKVEKKSISPKRQEKGRNKVLEVEKAKQAAREEALNPTTPWFMFVRSCIEMEDWYLALIHASTEPSKTPTLAPLQPVFLPADMHHLVSTLDEQPDVIPTRWLNALIGRVFFSYYRTHRLEHYIIGRLMHKLSKVKKPTFLTDVAVTKVSVGNKPPTLSKPMLKELTKEGDASMEVHFHYKGEFRITIQATANINIGKSYTVKLVLAAVLKELEGNLLIKIKRPPSSRIWYAFTQAPRMVLEVEPIVSDRQLTWSMILSTIETKLKEIVYESVVLPNMDDITFFDSSKFARRGGIWPDASRHEMPTAPLYNAVVADTQSIVSETTPDHAVPIVEETTPKVAHSTEELTVAVEPGVSPSPPPLAETNSAPVVETSYPRPTEKRRRSWFSGVRSEEESTSRKGIFLNPDDEEIDDDLQRGRSKDSDKGSIASFRSRSTPQNSDYLGGRSRDTTPETDDTSARNAYLMPQVNRRSSSQHSSHREHTKSPSTDSSKSTPDLETSTPKKTSTINPNSAASFFTTLKSRAGDKQALSNTAKEAMRKWGVNWGAKKESNSGDVSDHGSIGSTISARLRPDTTFSVANKARASYAEVRAAVAERKGRTIGANNDGADCTQSSLSSTLPVSIPDSSRGKARSISNPLSGSEPMPLDTEPAGPSSFPESVTLSTSADSTGSSSYKHLSAVSRRSSVSATEAEGASPILPSKPIHVVQPTAKTMTIPGIHASHRGEIMSMGYVAPPQPPVMTSDGKSSIYRLFKTSTGSNPGSSGSARPPSPSVQPASVPQSSTQESIVTSNEPCKEALQAPLSPNVATTITSAAVLSPTPPRVPPPLPPRSPKSRPPIRSTLSEAQEALKIIACTDERRRSASFENVAALSVTSHNGVSDSPNVSYHADADEKVGDRATVPVSDAEPQSITPTPTPTPQKPSTLNPNAPPLPPRRPPQSSPEAQLRARSD